MTQVPQTPEPNRPNSEGRKSVIYRARLIFVLGLVTAGVASGIAIRQWIYAHLVPLVEQSMLALIERPVELGDVEGFSLTHIRFGKTLLPPTQEDPDRAIVEAIHVRFNPIEVLINRSLSFDVLLINPTAVVEQDASGQWIDTEIQSLEPGAIEFKLGSVRFRDAHVALIPHGGSDATVGEQPVTVEGTGVGQSLNDSESIILERGLPEQWPSVASPFVWLRGLEGTATLRDENERILFDLAGQSGRASYNGTFEVEGELNREPNDWQVSTVVRTQGFDITPFLPLVPELPVTLTGGVISSNVQGTFNASGEIDLQGTAQFRDFGAQATGLPNQFQAGQGRLRFQGQNVQLEDTTLQFGDSVLSARGRIDLRNNVQDAYDLIIGSDSLDIATMLRDVNVQLPVDVEGQLAAVVQVSGPLEQPLITGTVNQASLIRVDRLELDAVGARFRLLPDTLEVNAIQVSPSEGGLITGSGQVGLDDDLALAFVFDLSDLPGDAIARSYLTTPLPDGFEIGTIAAGAQIFGTLQRPRLTAQWTAPQGTFPARGDVEIVGNQVALRDMSVRLGDGTVFAEADLSLDTQQWEAIATLNQLALSTVLPEQPGVVDGEIALSGTLQDFSPTAIQGEGQFNLADAPILGEPVSATVRWVGTGIDIEAAIAPSIQARGFVGVDFGTAEFPAITALDLEVRAQDIALDSVAAFLPETVAIAGLASFDGQVTGTLAMPSIDGELALQNLVVNDLAFEPRLSGTTQFTLGDGGRINLVGQQDQITATVDRRYYPTEFSIRRGQIVAQGGTQGDRLQASLENFPIGILNLRPAENLGLGRIDGWLTGSVFVDLATLDITDLSTLSASGDVAIVEPRLGHIEGDRFTGRFLYGNGTAVVNGGTLAVGQSEYDVVGRFSPTSDTLFRGQITAAGGSIQDVLVAFKYFELPDLLRFFDPPQYGAARDLDLIPIQISDTTLLRQLQRYAEIEVLRRLRQAEAEEEMFFPQLSELSGSVSGTIDVAVTRESGLSADFELSGENWKWGDYDEPNQIIAQGSFSNNTITLLPFRFSAGDTLINFAGQIGQAEDSLGQLRVENVPADQIADFFRIPVSLAGNLNATAALTGSIMNIQGRGEFSLVDGVINQTPIQEAAASFSYADARLNLIGSMLVSENDPIRAIGSIPYQLPQGIVPPASDEISLDIQIENDGLSVLNLLNDQVSWNGGEATVSLQVGGTLRQTSNGIDLQPLAVGFAEVRDGSFSAQVLPAPLTGVTGTVQFNRDRIQVNDVRGQFSDGEFVAQGVIPLAAPLEIGTENPDTAPLAVDLNDLAMNVKGLYNGGVNGRITVGGTVFSPRVGGELTLSNGRVSLPDTTVLGVATANVGDETPFATLFSPPELDQLQVVLGSGLLITRAPILNFVATGSLVVNGPLNDFRNLRPDGVIRLRSGQVNIFTTQFNLIRRRENVAIFRPNDGLDPFLNVRLATSVLEQTRSPIPPSSVFSQSEIVDSSANDFAGLETVRIQAEVEGPASQIFENLELSSSPGRSENEILALIGGGFVDTQGQGDSSLAIASLAGTALFTSIQNLLSNALGISDFRIFPAVITDDEREEGSSDANSTSTLGLAAELGVDLTRNLSVSALQFLTVQEPTQFSLRYRLNDQLQLRGLTNFSDENRIVLEYEARF